jgi:hypothetical protein
MPGEGLTHGPPATRKAGGSHHRFSRIIRHSLRDGFNGVLRAPRGPGFLAPVARDHLASLTPASGCQDHTTSPSASATFVRTNRRARDQSVHRIPASRSVTIGRHVPLHRGGMAGVYSEKRNRNLHRTFGVAGSAVNCFTNFCFSAYRFWPLRGRNQPGSLDRSARRANHSRESGLQMARRAPEHPRRAKLFADVNVRRLAAFVRIGCMRDTARGSTAGIWAYPSTNSSL